MEKKDGEKASGVVNLDKFDRVILYELDKNCRIPLSRLAKRVGRSRQSVEYRIENLVSSGVITSFYASINPHRLGFRLYKIYLQLKNIEAERERLINHLKKLGSVYWMGQCDGEWDLIFAVSARSEREFFELKNEIFSKFGNIIIKHNGDMYVDVLQYARGYFTGKREGSTYFAGDVANNKIDKAESRILKMLMEDARLHVNEIARRCNTTPAIVRSKMKRMEKLGIIIQYRIGINVHRLGIEMFKAIIHIDKFSPEEEKRFISFVGSIPNTNYIVRNLWQIEPEFTVQNYGEYLAIINMIKKNFPSFIRNVESVLMKTDEWAPGYKNIVS